MFGIWAQFALAAAAAGRAVLVGVRDVEESVRVQALFAAVAAHRLVADAEGDRRDALAASILGAVAVD